MEKREQENVCNVMDIDVLWTKGEYVLIYLLFLFIIKKKIILLINWVVLCIGKNFLKNLVCISC